MTNILLIQLNQLLQVNESVLSSLFVYRSLRSLTSFRAENSRQSSVNIALDTVELTWSVFRHPCRNDKFSTCRRFCCLFRTPQHPCCAVIEQFSSFHIVSLCFLNVSQPMVAKRACAGFAPRAICPTYCL